MIPHLLTHIFLSTSKQEYTDCNNRSTSYKSQHWHTPLHPEYPVPQHCPHAATRVHPDASEEAVVGGTTTTELVIVLVVVQVIGVVITAVLVVVELVGGGVVMGAEAEMTPAPQVDELVLHDNVGELRDEFPMWILYPPEPDCGIIHCCLTTYKRAITPHFAGKKRKDNG